MIYQTNKDQQAYAVAILLKEQSLVRHQMDLAYFTPMRAAGLDTDHIISVGVDYDDPKKVKVSTCKEVLRDLLPDLDSMGVSTLWCADPHYFKVLTKERKAEPHLGYVLDCQFEGYEGRFSVIYAPNHASLFYAPENKAKIDLAIATLSNHLAGSYQAIGTNIIDTAAYPTRLADIDVTLQRLHQYPQLTCDIETYSLKFNEAGIGTIAFAWDEHNGVAFRVDYDKDDPNQDVRLLLKEFFESYQGVLIFHNANFDMKVLVFTLWMEHLLDYKGRDQGIETLTRNFHDTKLITYLATNSTTGNKLSLKEQAHEFAGNYAQDDIKDIRKIDEDALLEYNLVDCLCTWFVFNKHLPTMCKDRQIEVYESIFKPSVQVILQMELTGMPVNMKTVLDVERELKLERAERLRGIHDLQVTEEFTYVLREQEQIKANAKLKKKVKPIEDFDHINFNPNSNPQLQQLLYDYLHLPVLDYTDTKQPATGAKTLKKLKSHVQNNEPLTKLLDYLCDFFEIDKILGTFIKALKENSIPKGGWHFLHGNFNLGGTVSGRLSSSGPNLQNLPSNSKYAKHVKRCFEAPPGWLFVGADFASLEDRISALTTKDPQKLKVYTDGYDGHSLRAYGYFSDEMPDIDPTSVSSINSISDKYEALRQKSKGPTFALTYGGTWITLVKNLGLSEDEAKQIEANYHRLYTVSDEWVAQRLNEAAKNGYVEVAFGLRVRTPMMKKCIWGSETVPKEALAESRTAGNALGQSYGLLNNRAAIEVREAVLKSEYAEFIQPIAHIHDAQYFMVRDNEHVVKFLNDHLIKAMEWQDLPDIRHPSVGLGGELSIFYPTWAQEYKVPNYVSTEEIRKAVQPDAA